MHVYLDYYVHSRNDGKATGMKGNSRGEVWISAASTKTARISHLRLCLSVWCPLWQPAMYFLLTTNLICQSLFQNHPIKLF